MKRLLFILLALSSFALGQVKIIPYTTPAEVRAESVSHVNPHALMADSYRGKIYVAYTPAVKAHLRQDMIAIAARQFDGVVTAPVYADRVTKAAKDLPIEVVESAVPNSTVIYLPSGDGPCGSDTFAAWLHVRVHTKGTAIPVVIEDWDRIKGGLAGCQRLTITASRNEYEDTPDLHFNTYRTPLALVHHYEIYVSTDGKHFMQMATGSQYTRTFNFEHHDLPHNQRYYLMVRMVGYPMYHNVTSNIVSAWMGNE